jgi:AhpD family alkylhydroperoxidase
MMDEKTKELIAIGASVTAHCQPCITFHVKKAQELGVSAEMIKEAIGVGQAVEKGAASAMRDFIQERFGKTDRQVSCCSSTGSDATSGGKACCCR